jgi:hypothetical protein
MGCVVVVVAATAAAKLVVFALTVVDVASFAVADV